MSRVKSWFKGSSVEDILSVGDLEPIGPISWQKLYRSFPSFVNLLTAPKSKLLQAGLTDHQANVLSRRPKNLEAQKHLLTSKSISLLSIDDKNYPPLLREINDPPLWLYYRGDVSALSTTTLTVVGTRKPSPYALQAIKRLLPDFVVSNLTIVSGLAYGIDKQAHMLSLENNHPTVAVLAGGLDSIYPADHSQLAQKIIDGGGVLVSEYPPLSRPRPARFPVRNRIIAGLSRLTVVIEAAIRSGSLTTAKSALDYNREIFAVPADILRRDADGTNFLIKHGATLLDNPSQIAEFYGFKANTLDDVAVDSANGKLLDLIIKAPLSVDTLVELTGSPIEEVLGILTELEIGGQVFQPQNGYYQRRK
ncbi:DNA protecting protein DprA [Candidatus Berkelbacteria bacterium RIFCSPLOWO2_01_FULL_50_28]|uniref:DNA protecting protein DprA n=1 Tax=Candidatus Berkelbacteria bacterium RIFCSPLOWO2_01_FULL_50_28 TaxID=1797471 RepID=A0A1F5EBQ1_9BACT|nr:MAG: DNA protecting protein DprA [Candidatus Berkelbacteria bacterium RIFCSPHIGHO2_12_FULL_50_11]OGD64793.1 MAG: DNA protecting protein DprA [Candidatus Berkelbacteria bacterium RIFCSPLOWO2_01_FULL_50_28]